MEDEIGSIEVGKYADLVVLDKKVLLVEDDIASYIFFREYLQPTGIEVIPSFTGEEAIHRYEEREDIDIVLLDLHLPDMNGIEVFRKMINIHSGIPIIAQTAINTSEVKSKCKNAGFNEFVINPIFFRDFINIMSKYLM